MGNIFKYIAIATGLAALAIRLASYATEPQVSAALAKALMLPAVVVAVAAGGSLHWALNPLPQPLGETSFDYRRRRNADIRQQLGARLAHVPHAVKAVFFIAGFYLMVSTFWTASHLERGQSEARHDGSYWLVYHGHNLRQISKSEYQRWQALEARLIAGFALILSLTAVIQFQFVHPHLWEDNPSTTFGAAR